MTTAHPIGRALGTPVEFHMDFTFSIGNPSYLPAASAEADEVDIEGGASAGP